MTIEQISVFLENRAGQLSELTAVLAENHVDLRAIHIAEATDYGVLRIIAANSDDATKILLEHGFILNKTQVVAVGVPDETGSLAKLLNVLAGAGLDIEYMYSTYAAKGGTACMILRVADVGKLEEVLAANGFESLDGSVLGLA